VRRAKKKKGRDEAGSIPPFLESDRTSSDTPRGPRPGP
jgi:hypothetical protein